MDERRNSKNVPTKDEVKKQLNNELRQDRDKAREEWWVEVRMQRSKEARLNRQTRYTMQKSLPNYRTKHVRNDKK